MSVFRKIMALLLSLVMIASMSTALVFAEDVSPTASGVSYVFSKFARKGASANGISGIHEFDAASSDEFLGEFAIYEKRTDDTYAISPITLDLAKFVVSTPKIIELKLINEFQGTYDAFKITAIENGECTITYPDPANAGSLLTLSLNVINVQPKPAKPEFETHFASVGVDGVFEGLTNRRTDTKDHGAWHDAPYKFAKIRNKENVKPNEPGYTFVEFFSPKNLEIEIRDYKTEVIADYSDTIKLGKDNKGNNVIQMNPRGTPGKYRVWFYYTSEIESENDGRNPRNKNCARYFDYELLPAPKESHIKVPGDFDTIQKAIDSVTPEKESSNTQTTFIEVAEGTYTENIVVNKKVFIYGAGFGKTILNGTIVFDANEHNGSSTSANAQVKQLTLRSTETGVGTGVQVNDNKFGVFNLEIDGFAIGAKKPGRNLGANGTFKNCGVGYEVDMAGFIDNISRVQAFDFENNDTAIRITGDGKGAAGNALLIYNSNFENNKINIDDAGGDNYSLYVAYNYFAHGTGFDYDASLKSKFKFAATSTAKTVSPYYRTPITLDNGIFTYPAKAYAIASELADLSIDKSMADKPIDTTNFAGAVNIKLSTISAGGSSTVAGWDFAATNPALAATFNPAIATTLKDSSANAVATLPSGTTYQPVSFAHSGALPGTATVNVVKNADAPTTNLKLYKVVGNALVLQPDAVSFENGEYKFNRDGASDYIITDTVISSGNNDDDNDSSSGGSSGGSNDYVGSDEIKDKLENATGSNVSLSVAGKPNVSASLFDILKTTPDKTITLKGDGYAWSFKGSDIKNTIPGLLSFNSKISNTSPNAAEIQKVTGDAETVNVYFSYHGQLPGRATVELAVNSKYNGKTLNFYHYNAAKKQLETVATNIPVKDGKISVSITHCSDYILSPAALKATAATTTVNVINPDTGATDNVSLAIALAAMSCLGIFAISRTKK